MEAFITGNMILGWIELVLFWPISWAGCDENVDDVVWITKNYDANWCITRFLPPHALAYEKLCERINGPGLALMLVILSLLTYPTTIFMGALALIAFCVRRIWKWFCETFEREQEEEEDVTVTEEEDGWHYAKVVDWSKQNKKHKKNKKNKK